MRLSIVLAGAALLSATTAYIEDADDEFDLPYSELADFIERTLASDFDHVCLHALRRGLPVLESDVELGASFD
jgi:hypothetical protein